MNTSKDLHKQLERLAMHLGSPAERICGIGGNWQETKGIQGNPRDWKVKSFDAQKFNSAVK